MNRDAVIIWDYLLTGVVRADTLGVQTAKALRAEIARDAVVSEYKPQLLALIDAIIASYGDDDARSNT